MTPRIFSVFISLFLATVFHARAEVHGPNLTFGVESGRVYSQHNPFDRWYPASLTKLMTAYVVLAEIERGHVSMKSPVRISPNALSKPPSKMGFPVGTILTVEAAVKIIMVKSANDVSTALAESVAGSEANFARLMNRYAAAIGMRDSHFVNPHGLHNVAQYTTPRDLGLLARQIFKQFPQHEGLFGMQAIQVGQRTYRNHNALMRHFPDTMGMKTGFICAGGLSVVTSSRRKGETMVSIVMGGQSGKARNALAAQLQAVAWKRVESDTLPKLDELTPDGFAKPPEDISQLVCGKKGRSASALMDDDPAVEYFPVTQMSTAERLEAYFNKEPLAYSAELVEFGKAVGPDPYELLVEKPPIVLAEEFSFGSADEEPEERFSLADGRIVAVPTPKPI